MDESSPEPAAGSRGGCLGFLWLFLANAGTVALAMWQEWPLLPLLWPYWFQSVVIGWYARKRMLALKRFSTEEFKSGGVQPPATRETLRSNAAFFALHYGLFHFVYLGFLALFTFGHLEGIDVSLTGKDWLAILAAGLAFALTHAETHRRQVEVDARGTPYLGRLFLLPYARVVPMHLTILFGLMLGASEGVLFFGALKAGADLLMEWVDRRASVRDVGEDARSAGSGPSSL